MLLVQSEQKQTNATLDPNHILPSVTFDINLGKQFSRVDFDFDSYIAHLKESGLSDNDVSSTKVQFHDASASHLTQGRYSRYTGAMDVFLEKDTTESNKTVIHETQHRIDDAHGLLEKYRDKNITMNIIRLGGLAMLAAGIATETAALFTDNHTLLTGSSAALITSIPAQLGTYIAYKRITPERRARKAEREISTQFITTVRK
jgi:hypothetical protein